MATLDDSYTSTNRNSANIAENTAQEPQQHFRLQIYNEGDNIKFIFNERQTNTNVKDTKCNCKQFLKIIKPKSDFLRQ